MRKGAVVCSLVCVFVAAGLAAWGFADRRAMAQGTLKCQPQFGPAASSSGFVSKTWTTGRPPTQDYPQPGLYVTAWWEFVFQMQYQFNCGGGNDSSNCKICRYTTVDYFSSTNNSWIQAPMGFDGYYSDTGDCQSTMTLTLQTTYDYPIKAGTSLQITWYGALYDPMIGACNNGEEYQELQVYQYTVPADGP